MRHDIVRSVDCVSAIDAEGRTIWIVDAHRDGKRFVVRADEKLTAFVEPGILQFAPGSVDLTGWRNLFKTGRR
jgi:hypothetical protein